MLLRPTIIEQLTQVAKEQNKKVLEMSDEVILLDSGLDSLCFAIVVSRLEDLLGVDPFSSVEELRFPTTVGEFISLYEQAAR
ncbi:MAG: acyl carrier protein [Rhodospirillales bacterium]|nr:acyl carrier protein [Rhodospirillales bacterium]